MKIRIKEETIGDIIKKHINTYQVNDDPYDVAIELGKKYKWSQNQIEKAENILRKQYLKEEEEFTPIEQKPEAQGNKQFQIVGSLITNTKVKPQTDILSAIRSLPGVTIVNSQASVPGSNSEGQLRYKAGIDIKIDTHSLKGDVKQGIKDIITKIKNIEGVVEFKIFPKAKVTKPY